MRILLLSTSYSVGGAARSARDLFELLLQRGHDVDMLVGADSPAHPCRVRSIRPAWEKYLKAIPSLTSWFAGIDIDWRHMGSRRRLARVRSDEYDVVHAHNLHSGWISYAAVRELAQRIPLVWTFHDEYPITLVQSYDLSHALSRQEIRRRFGFRTGLHKDDGLARSSRRHFAPRLPQPTAIISPSGYLAQLAKDSGRYPGVPVHQVPYGLRMLESPKRHASREESRRAWNLPSDAKVILLISAYLWSPFKGMWLGMEALQKLCAAGTDKLHVVIAGGSSINFDLPSGLPTSRLGEVSQEKLASVYRAADVTLIPSIADNFPYVALESFACETPVVSFAIGGLTELVGDDQRGRLARRIDAQALADALAVLLRDDDQRDRAGIAARQWVEQKCNASAWIDRHLEVYREAIDGFATARPTASNESR